MASGSDSALGPFSPHDPSSKLAMAVECGGMS